MVQKRGYQIRNDAYIFAGLFSFLIISKCFWNEKFNTCQLIIATVPHICYLISEENIRIRILLVIPGEIESIVNMKTIPKKK